MDANINIVKAIYEIVTNYPAMKEIDLSPIMVNKKGVAVFDVKALFKESKKL